MPTERFTFRNPNEKKGFDLAYLSAYPQKEFDAMSKNRPIVIGKIEKPEHVVGVLVEVEGRRHYLARAASASESEVESSLRSIADGLLSREGIRLMLDGAPLLRLGSSEQEAPLIRNSVLTIDAPIEEGARLKAMKDNGSLEKANWRMHLIEFAARIFPNGPAPHASVVFFPGASDSESALWKAFGFSVGRMVMIEGDASKARELHERYRREKNPPVIVAARMGAHDSEFMGAFEEGASDRKIGILSMDTESAFSLPLYDDLVSILTDAELGRDLFFSLNLVARGSLAFCADFLENAARRTGVAYPVTGNSRHDLMCVLPQILLHDAGRTDYSVQRTAAGTYLGNNASTMEYVFAHISKREPKS